MTGNELEETALVPQNKYTKDLATFDVALAGITELETRYMVLTVQGEDDKDGQAMCHKARMDVKNRRIAVEKEGELMRADAVAFSKAVIDRVKPIKDKAAKIEAHLQEQEDIVANAAKRRKEEEAQKEAEKQQAMVDRICQFNPVFNGNTYSVYGVNVPVALLKVCTDEQFKLFISQIETAKEAEEKKLKDQEEERKAEEARLEKIRQDQEEERKRLEEISRKQAEEAARIKAEQEEKDRKIKSEQEEERKRLQAEADRLKAEQDAVEAERQRLADEEKARKQAEEDERRRKEEEERKKKEREELERQAAEKAKKDEEERIQREAAEKAESERLAKIEAERQEALKPDKEKLMAFSDSIEMVLEPQGFKDEAAISVMIRAKASLAKVADTIRKEARSL